MVTDKIADEDRIRRKYVDENFSDLPDKDKEQLVKNLKKAEAFTRPKRESSGFLYGTYVRK